MKYRVTVLNVFAVFILLLVLANMKEEDHFQVTIFGFSMVIFWLIVDVSIQKIVTKYPYVNLIEVVLLVFVYGFLFFARAF